jgi:hypothetical protein
MLSDAGDGSAPNQECWVDQPFNFFEQTVEKYFTQISVHFSEQWSFESMIIVHYSMKIERETFAVFQIDGIHPENPWI